MLRSPFLPSRLNNALMLSALTTFCVTAQAQPPATPQSTPSPATSQPASSPTVLQSSPASATSGIRAVTVVSPKYETWTEQIEAQGNVMPWQEIRVNTDVSGLRLTHVLVGVGDMVKKGQVLAELDTASVEAELEAVNAQLMEAQATLTQAEATLDRAKRLAPSGGVSQQDLTQFETQKRTAAARLAAAQARVKSEQLKLDSAKLLAPDDGMISSRSVDDGDIIRSGSELFRLIRQGRLEWRAEVKGEMLLKLAPGLEATIESPLGQDFKGRVRMLSPTIDLKTHTGLAYIDLPINTNFRAGLRVAGTLAVSRKVLTLPVTAISHSDDGDRVFTVSAANKVQSVRIRAGRSQDDLREIIGGLPTNAKVIDGKIDGLKAGEPVSIQTSTPAAQSGVRP